MEIKILAVCGSPIKGEVTNTEFMLKEVTKSCQEYAVEVGDKIEADLVLLSEKKIKLGCIHCNWCLEHQTADAFCSIKDDMEKEIFPKIVEADGLILGTPVYIGGMSWLMACFVHRLRALAEGRYYGLKGPFGVGGGGLLTNKILACVSVAWVRNNGVETALLNELFAAYAFNMIPVTASINGLYGVGGISAAPPGEFVAVKNDRLAMAGAQTLGRRVIELCRLVKAGEKALKYFPSYL
jgi:multimeric flavodoxin WrbA